MQLVAPIMRKQRSGRIINISSVAGRLGYPLFGWYCASKHALEGLSDAARLELSPWGVRVVLVEPGPVEDRVLRRGQGARRAADRRRHVAVPGRSSSTADAIERKFMKQATTADNVARVVMKACLKSKPKARYAVTGMAKATVMATRLLPRRWLDAVIKKEFRVPRAADVS